MADWIEVHESGLPTYAEELKLADLARGQRHRLAVSLIEDGASRAVRVPVIVLRGARPGHVVGVTAAVHGNELNGIPTIHRLFARIDPEKLTGTVVGVPICNMPAYIANQRKYTDGQDLNRLFPGRADGNESQVYAWRLVHRIVRHFDYLLDLHTASFGRVNSLYVRADMTRRVPATLARLIGAEILVHNEGGDYTLRAAADALGIHAITVEIGDPQVFDRGMIKASRIGLRDVLEHLSMLEPDEEGATRKAVECVKSYWLYTDTGGLLDVLPGLTDRVSKGQPIARLVDPWGQPLRVYKAPEDGIVIGKSTNPVATTGSRILHLGILGEMPKGTTSPALSET